MSETRACGGAKRALGAIGSGSPAIVGLAAHSGSGKTTLAVAVIAALRQRGLRVGVIKHAHHEFDVDVPGKDSYRLRKAGAVQTLIGSRRRWALVTELDGRGEPSLHELLGRLDLGELDVVLVEGFKHERFPKIEICRRETGAPLLHPTDPDVVALATDASPSNDPAPSGAPVRAHPLPVLDLNDPEAVADFVVACIVEPARAARGDSSAHLGCRPLEGSRE